MATKSEAEQGTAGFVAELEKQLGGKLTQARADLGENNKERTRLAARHKDLDVRKSAAGKEYKELLIAHGKGMQGAQAKRNKAERELEDINQEIEAVDAAIVYENERNGLLSVALSEMETKLDEARKRQQQTQIAEALTEKKEAFIAAFVNACTLLAETVKLSDRLLAADGRTFLDQTLEDLLFRTNRGILIDSYKFTEVQSGMGLARRVFEVVALVPPPPPET